MSLADDLQQARRDARRKKCATCGFYADLSDEDREHFDAAAADPELSVAELWRACAANGLTIGRSVFLDHMREHHGQGSAS
jgi:hypothetical protein